MAASDSTPLPIKNQALQITFGMWLTTGLVNSGASSPDSEISKDGGAYADCTNEITEIGSSGTYTLDLTSTEMNADVVAIQVKSGTANAITYKITIYPSSGSKMQVNAVQVGSQTASAAGAVTFPGTVASATNITAGTITTVTNLTNAPTSGDLTATMKTSVTTAATAATPTLAGTQTFNNTGTWTGNIVGTLSTVTTLTNLPAITANWLTATGISAGAITAAKFAASAIDAAALAADAAAEIAVATRDVNNTSPAASSLGAAVNSAASAGDPWATTIPGAYGAGTAGFILGTYLTAAAPTANANADALLNRTDGVETGVTPKGTLRALLAAMAGVATGGNTTTIVLKDPSGSAARVTLTVDADGNRSASTLNV